MTSRDELLDELRPTSFAIAYRMLGSVTEAEDVVQEALLRVHQSLDAGDDIASPRAFVATVTTRLAINELRSARVRRERYVGEWTNLVPGRPTLSALVKAGTIPAVFAESEDPDRLVPIVCRAEDLMVAVSGDPLRTNAYAFAHNGILGYPTTKPVRLPAEWPRLLREARSR